MGDTIYRLGEFRDLIPDLFIPASALADLRRRFVEALDASRTARFARPLRLPENPEAEWPEGDSLDFHANVANSLAERVYREHGVSGPIQPALEVAPPAKGAETIVMTTRYCLRREIGACLKTPGSTKLPRGPLSLCSPGMPPLTLEFDCRNCQMNVIRK